MQIHVAKLCLATRFDQPGLPKMLYAVTQVPAAEGGDPSEFSGLLKTDLDGLVDAQELTKALRQLADAIDTATRVH